MHSHGAAGQEASDALLADPPNPHILADRIHAPPGQLHNTHHATVYCNSNRSDHRHPDWRRLVLHLQFVQ